MGSDAGDFLTSNEIGDDHHEHGAFSPSTVGTLSAVKLCTISPRSIQHFNDRFYKVPYSFNGWLPWARYHPN